MPTVHELSSSPYARLPPPSTRVTKNGSAVADIEKSDERGDGSTEGDREFALAQEEAKAIAGAHGIARRRPCVAVGGAHASEAPRRPR